MRKWKGEGVDENGEGECQKEEGKQKSNKTMSRMKGIKDFCDGLCVYCLEAVFVPVTSVSFLHRPPAGQRVPEVVGGVNTEPDAI